MKSQTAMTGSQEEEKYNFNSLKYISFHFFFIIITFQSVCACVYTCATFIFLRDKKIQGSDLRDKFSGTFIRVEADR